MADQAVVHIGENSPEHVAYQLFRHISTVENKSVVTAGVNDRAWILDTYAECLNTVRNPAGRVSSRTRTS
jgi:hypothetical protein